MDRFLGPWHTTRGPQEQDVFRSTSANEAQCRTSTALAVVLDTSTVTCTRVLCAVSAQDELDRGPTTCPVTAPPCPQRPASLDHPFIPRCHTLIHCPLAGIVYCCPGHERASATPSLLGGAGCAGQARKLGEHPPSTCPLWPQTRGRATDGLPVALCPGLMRCPVRGPPRRRASLRLLWFGSVLPPGPRVALAPAGCRMRCTISNVKMSPPRRP